MLFLFDNLGFVWLFLILGAVRERHTPPAPLKRGGLDADFSLIMNGLSGGIFLCRKEVRMVFLGEYFFKINLVVIAFFEIPKVTFCNGNERFVPDNRNLCIPFLQLFLLYSWSCLSIDFRPF